MLEKTPRYELSGECVIEHTGDDAEKYIEGWMCDRTSMLQSQSVHLYVLYGVDRTCQIKLFFSITHALAIIS
jgi:hypothetical protein